MKTTIDIPEKLLDATLRITGAATKRDAVVQALEDFTRRNRVADIVASFGTWDMLDNDSIEAADVAEWKRRK
jgi:Arc/MetJ family transcription regulator